MITCRELAAFTDEACDLTREMDAMERAKEATVLLGQIEQVPQKFLMQWRAAAVADLHYLHGRSMRSIAVELGVSPQAALNWLLNHGPTRYLMVLQETRDGISRATLRVFKVDGENTKVKIRQYRAAGRRIVPATMNLLDPDDPETIDPAIDADALWLQLADQA